MQAPHENLIICDGEKGKNRGYLNRRVALVPLDSLEGKVEPLILYEKLEKENWSHRIPDAYSRVA